MGTLRVTGCKVDTQSITISFSEPVDQTSPPAFEPTTKSSSAHYIGNYTILAPSSGISTPQPVWSPKVMEDEKTVRIALPSTVSFSPGDWVVITVQNVASLDGKSTIDGTQTFPRQVPIVGRTTRDVEDAISYPILTEEIGYRPSPVGMPTGGGGGSYGGGGGGSNLGMVAMRAVSDVLGWKPSSTDPQGFVGALTQSFDLTDVEGHVESTWVPRTYAVQTDLGGGISGAQASLYTRAKDALDQSLSLLDGLYPLDPDADPEYVKALREMARSQMTEIVRELGTVGLPSILRIDTYFEILLGQHPTRHFTHVEFNPDKIKGTLGDLRQTYGIYFRGNPWNNSVKDEEDITNFRVISDYMTSLLQSWIANREFFVVSPNQVAFFGTQLVLISRQLNVIAETVNEVRFTLDSVFIGPNERQTLLLQFSDHSLPAMFLEDMLVEIEKFVTDEGPRLLRDGGKISVKNNILPVVKSLDYLVQQAHDPKNKEKVPDGYRTARVKRSLDDLHDQLRELARLTEQVEQQLPIPKYALTINGIAGSSSSNATNGYTIILSFFGSGFVPGASVVIHSGSLFRATPQQTVFYSAERIDVTFNSTDPNALTNESHEVRITNPDGESATLRFTYNFSDSDGNPDVNVTATNGAGNGQVFNAAEAANQTIQRTAKAGAGAAAGGAAASPRPAAVTQSASNPVAAATASSPPAPPAIAPPATDVGTLKNQVDQLHEAHKSFAQDVRDKFDKLFSLVEKNKK